MRIGRYNVVSVLGHGAFGEVFHARLDGPMGFSKDVALKRLHPHLVRGNPAVVQALIDEARLGGLLRHPNIVESHEFEQDEGTWFLAMEFVDGLTLEQLAALSAEAGRPIPPAIALEIIEQLCRGLDYAHALRDGTGAPLRIVHRDLKPANLMLSREGVLKIMDFGMAKAASNVRDATASGTIKGTPSYMSPEQVHGTRLITEASDLYAVGVMFYELLMGARLFEGDTAVSVMFAVISGVRPEQVAALDAAVPGAGPILARCIATDPDERWETAAALGRAVGALRDTLPEPPGALRALAVSLLQSPSRLGPEELSKRSVGFLSYLDSVQVSLARERSQRGDLTPASPVGDATQDAVHADATRAALSPQARLQAQRGADATRDSLAPPPGVAPPEARRMSWQAPLALSGVGASLLAAAGVALWVFNPLGAPDSLPASAAVLAEPPSVAPSVATRPDPSSAPIPPAATPDVAPPAVDAPPKTPPKKPKVEKPQAIVAPPPVAVLAGEGALLVKSSPWGWVSIDGGPPVMSPVRRKVGAGKHSVKVDCGECTTPSTRTFDVVVEPDGLEPVTAEFTK